jgi:uncharacterized protein YkwD
MLCEVNAVRARYRLRPLTSNTALTTAAQWHANTMAIRRFFAHGNVFSRIKRSGYLGSARSYGYGETLAFNCGANAAPGPIVVQWLNSPYHRSRVLNPLFKHVGFGVTAWTPNGCAGGTYVGTYGFRR